MTTYICKCGRRVKKSTDASTTGNRLSGYAPGHECWGCPYAMPYGNYQWDESARTVSRETQGYECRMSKTLTYASEFAGSIVNLMKYPQANLLVIRKVYRTLHDSCFTDLKWAISRLGVQAFWDVKESPLELTYKPTGQKILFRGLDDPLKITSIAAEHGYLCWAWIEEAYEISSEADFNMIDESIRGAIPPETGLFKQVTLTFNPWNEHHWLKARFFDTPDPDTLALTTNYTCNEWLDDADRRVFERMKVQNPRRYSVAGLGESPPRRPSLSSTRKAPRWSSSARRTSAATPSTAASTTSLP